MNSSDFELPIVQLITHEELHDMCVRRALVQAGLTEQEVITFFAMNNVTSRVTYRNVQQGDGSVHLMAAVAVTGVAPKPKTGKAQPSDPEREVT